MTDVATASVAEEVLRIDAAVRREHELYANSPDVTFSREIRSAVADFALASLDARRFAVIIELRMGSRSEYPISVCGQYGLDGRKEITWSNEMAEEIWREACSITGRPKLSRRHPGVIAQNLASGPGEGDVSVGRVALIARTPLTPVGTVAFKLLLHDLSDLVLAAARHRVRRDIDSAERSIHSPVPKKQTSKFVGWVAAKFRGALDSSHMAYLVLDGGTAYVHYLGMTGWANSMPLGVEGHPIGAGTVALCQLGHEFLVDGHLNRGSDQAALRNVVLQAVAQLPRRVKDRVIPAARYLCIPILHEDAPIGLVVYAISYDKPTWMSEAAVAARVIRPLVTNSARYAFQLRSGHLIANPIYRGRETKVRPGTAFVLMPFTQDWSERIWSRVLKPTLGELGFAASRADDMYGSDVMEDIWSRILTSEVIVADITSRNPNVFYELGLAHTVGKPVILLTQDAEDIPFDLNRYRHVIYADNMDGYDKLKKGLAGSVNEILRARS